MTDKKPEIQQASQAAAPAATSSPGPSTSAATAKKGQAAGKPRSVFLPAFLIVLLIALALAAGQIGRAHVCTPVTNAHLVCRLLLENKQQTIHTLSPPHQNSTEQQL